MKEAKLTPPPKTTTSVIKMIRSGSWQVFTGAELYWPSVRVPWERVPGDNHKWKGNWPEAPHRRCFSTLSWGVVYAGVGLCIQQHAIFWGKKREHMMLCVQINKSFWGAFSVACPNSPAMFKCWLRTKARSEKRDWLLTHPWGGWVCPRQAKGSPSWRRGCVAFTPDQEQKVASRTTPHTPSLSHCLLNIAELSPSAHENTNKVQKCF